jgi:hypothetical protein
MRVERAEGKIAGAGMLWERCGRPLSSVNNPEKYDLSR